MPPPGFPPVPPPGSMPPNMPPNMGMPPAAGGPAPQGAGGAPPPGPPPFPPGSMHPGKRWKSCQVSFLSLKKDHILSPF